VIWDVTRLAPDGRLPALDITDAELGALWDGLARGAEEAERACWKLVAGSARAVPFLGKQLQPVRNIAGERLARLIANLDSDDFANRERASEELAGLGELALPALRKALADMPSVEVRRRAEELVSSATRWTPRPARLRELRALRVLEQIGAPEARTVLERMAEGATEARLTREAKAALGRLGRREGKP
jgi:hypothetical protein